MGQEEGDKRKDSPSRRRTNSIGPPRRCRHAGREDLRRSRGNSGASSEGFGIGEREDIPFCFGGKEGKGGRGRRGGGGGGEGQEGGHLVEERER